MTLDIFKEAELHEDLKPHLGNLPSGMEALRHPLCYAVPYFEEMNHMLNQQYLLRKAHVEECLANRNLGAYVAVHERPYRLEAFMVLNAKYNLTDTEYWELLRELWGDSENIWQNRKLWHKLLKAKRGSREAFMSIEERAFIKKLPAQVSVYRGCIKGQNESGASWTLNRTKAVWFSKRFRKSNERATVLTKKVPRTHIFAYLNDRDEAEVILL